MNIHVARTPPVRTYLTHTCCQGRASGLTVRRSKVYHLIHLRRFSLRGLKLISFHVKSVKCWIWCEYWATYTHSVPDRSANKCAYIYMHYILLWRMHHHLSLFHTGNCAKNTIWQHLLRINWALLHIHTHWWDKLSVGGRELTKWFKWKKNPRNIVRLPRLEKIFNLKNIVNFEINSIQGKISPVLMRHLLHYSHSVIHWAVGRFIMPLIKGKTWHQLKIFQNRWHLFFQTKSFSARHNHKWVKIPNK